MAHLIDKSALVAEIEDWRDKIKKGVFSIPLTGRERAYATFEYEILGKVIDLLGTIEVKKVDLDESARNYLLHEHVSPLNEVLHQADLKVEMQYHKDIEDAYKAGFELGLKARKEYKDNQDTTRPRHEG